MSNFAQCFSNACFLLAHARAKQGQIFGFLCFAEFLVISLSRDAWVGTLCV